jgi:hypothetical protein
MEKKSKNWFFWVTVGLFLVLVITDVLLFTVGREIIEIWVSLFGPFETGEEPFVFSIYLLQLTIIFPIFILCSFYISSVWKAILLSLFFVILVYLIYFLVFHVLLILLNPGTILYFD